LSRSEMLSMPSARSRNRRSPETVTDAGDWFILPPVCPFGPGLFPIGAIESSPNNGQDSRMRVNLSTRPSRPSSSPAGPIPITLTIRPACGLPGDYEYSTDSAALLRLLRRQTDLPGYVLEGFEARLRQPVGARLLGVELSESVLTDIGYFID